MADKITTKMETALRLTHTVMHITKIPLNVLQNYLNVHNNIAVKPKRLSALLPSSTMSDRSSLSSISNGEL